MKLYLLFVIVCIFLFIFILALPIMILNELNGKWNWEQIKNFYKYLWKE